MKFRYDGNTYKTDDAAGDAPSPVVELPDGRFIKVGYWGESNPPAACNVTRFDSRPSGKVYRAKNA